MGNQNVKRAIWMGVTVIVVVVLVVVVRGIYGQKGGTSGNGTGADVAAAPETPTRTVAPANAVAPSEGSTGVAPSTAIPSVQVAAAPDSTTSFRSFSINVSNNAYDPSTIIVNQGDTVNLEITAVDGNYGFTQPDYGLNSTIAKGNTQKVQFQALQSGKFTFYCATCGGPAKGPVGYIIVTAQQ